MGYVQEARENHVKKKVEEGNGFWSRKNPKPPFGSREKKMKAWENNTKVKEIQRNLWNAFHSFGIFICPIILPFLGNEAYSFTCSDFLNALWNSLLHLLLHCFSS